ncbi:MAG: polysaccharide deacetylase family protein [Chthonomonadales bacterium]
MSQTEPPEGTLKSLPAERYRWKPLPYLILFLFFITLTLVTPWSGISLMDRWRAKSSGRLISSVSTVRKNVAISFDDGPDSRYTPTILGILKTKSIHATFFVCGEMIKGNKQLLKREIIEGHDIGNHSMTHGHLESMSQREQQAEIIECNRLLKSAGVEAHFFRPPRGRVTNSLIDLADKAGLKTVIWSIAFDKESEKDPAVLTARVVNQARPGDIILLHDGAIHGNFDRSRTITQLPAIIDGLRSKGLEPVTLTELLRSSQK